MMYTGYDHLLLRHEYVILKQGKARLNLFLRCSRIQAEAIQSPESLKNSNFYLIKPMIKDVWAGVRLGNFRTKSDSYHVTTKIETRGSSWTTSDRKI